MQSPNGARYRPPTAARRRVAAAATLLAGLAGTMLTVSLASASERHHDRPPPRHHSNQPPPADYLPGLYPQIGIDLLPQLEHWPGNYRPDNYRLRGYDGPDNGEHFCAGAHGRTLSSSGIRCPHGQKNDTGGRRYSTDANRHG